MKIFVLGSIIITIALCLSACGIEEVNSGMFNRMSDEEFTNSRFEQIVDAIENNDKDAMKSLFSESTRQNAADIDEEIKQLLTLFANGIDTWKLKGNQISESKNNGQRRKSINASFEVYVGEQQYYFYILDYIIDTGNPQKVGLSGMRVSNEKNKKIEAFSAGIIFAIK